MQSLRLIKNAIRLLKSGIVMEFSERENFSNTDVKLAAKRDAGPA